MIRQVVNFISESERISLLDIIERHNHNNTILNDHIRSVNSKTNGYSVTYDISKSNKSQAITKFQGDSTVIDDIDRSLIELSDKIIELLDIKSVDRFLQLIMLGENGEVPPHYDAGFRGYSTYKCNISVLGTLNLMISGSECVLRQNDLQSFDANIYKHSVHASRTRRAVVSFGFLIPYSQLNIRQSRMKLGDKISKKFFTS